MLERIDDMICLVMTDGPSILLQILVPRHLFLLLRAMINLAFICEAGGEDGIEAVLPLLEKTSIRTKDGGFRGVAGPVVRLAEAENIQENEEQVTRFFGLEIHRSESDDYNDCLSGSLYETMGAICGFR